jgi:serine/threonine protein kinase
MELFDEGGFSIISVDPEDKTVIRKKFVYKDSKGEIKPSQTNTNYLVQESILTYYFTDSPYIVKFLGINLAENTMYLERWTCSLKTAIRIYRLTTEQKLYIYRDVLYAICDMQSRGIIHSDIKPTNILFSEETQSATLCDLGLSSIVKYAKVKKGCHEYIPKTGSNKHIGYDMFALCLTMSELFAGIKPVKDQQRTPREMRELLAKAKMSNSRVKKSLMMMIPDNLSEAPSASKILKFVFGEERKPLPVAKIVIHPNTKIDIEDLGFIRENIATYCNAYSIQRSKRCFDSLVNFINSPSRKADIPAEKYDAYIAAVLFIYSSLFNNHAQLFEEKAYKLVNPSVTSLEEFRSIIISMVVDEDFVNLTLKPYSS